MKKKMTKHHMIIFPQAEAKPTSTAQASVLEDRGCQKLSFQAELSQPITRGEGHGRGRKWQGKET